MQHELHSPSPSSSLPPSFLPLFRCFAFPIFTMVAAACRRAGSIGWLATQLVSRPSRSRGEESSVFFSPLLPAFFQGRGSFEPTKEGLLLLPRCHSTFFLLEIPRVVYIIGGP